MVERGKRVAGRAARVMAQKAEDSHQPACACRGRAELDLVLQKYEACVVYFCYVLYIATQEKMHFFQQMVLVKKDNIFETKCLNVFIIQKHQQIMVIVYVFHIHKQRKQTKTQLGNL